MHETSYFFYSIITFTYAKYFVHSYTIDSLYSFLLLYLYYAWSQNIVTHGIDLNSGDDL